MHNNNKTSKCSIQEIEDINKSSNLQHIPPHLLSYPTYFPPLDMKQCIIYPSNISYRSFKPELDSISTRSTQENAIFTPNGINKLIQLNSRKENPIISRTIQIYLSFPIQTPFKYLRFLSS